ncbi:MAG: hypothetical protein EXR98_10560 [Gemmataceae bacterium]|nr:hypothetical protein [Gemmataceae bacterium]
MSTEKRSKTYPRALPHRTPEDAAKAVDAAPEELPKAARSTPSDTEPPARPNRRTFPLAVLVCALLLAGAGTAIWWDKTRQRSDDEIAPAPAPVSPVVASLSVPGVAAPKPAIEPGHLAPGLPGGTHKPEASGAAPADQPASPLAKERYLEALGSLTAAHLYQTFLNIGLLADAVENDQMEIAEAEKTLANLTRFMTLVETQLDQVASTDLDPSDRKALDSIRKHTESLRAQAAALREYWTTGDLDDAVAFHDARTQAWSGISAMLGLENMSTETVAKNLKTEK